MEIITKTKIVTNAKLAIATAVLFGAAGLAFMFFPTFDTSDLSIRSTVTSRTLRMVPTLTQTGIPGSILVMWSKSVLQRYRIVYKKSSDPPTQASFSQEVYDREYWGMHQIYGLEDGTPYDVQVYRDDGDTTNVWRSNIPFQTITPVSRDLTTERLVFVFPRAFSLKNGFADRINEYMNGLNEVYAMNTRKIFVLDDILYYDERNCRGAVAEDPCDVLTNPAYVRPYTLPIMYVLDNSPPNPARGDAGIFPRLRIRFTMHSDPQFIYQTPLDMYFPPSGNPLNSYWGVVSNFAHELGHTYGAGVPEMYLYKGKDHTGVAPLILGPTHSTELLDPLPARFELDPMKGTGQRPQFSDLSAAIINSNIANHTEFYNAYIQPSEQSRFYSFMPPIMVHINDTADGSPVSGATVRMYCLRDIVSDDGGGRLLQTVTSDQLGIAVLMAPSMVGDNSGDHGCLVEGIKIYADGYTSKAITITGAELQEAKIVNGQKYLDQAVTLDSVP